MNAPEIRSLVGLSKDHLLLLAPESVKHPLSAEEFIWIARELGALWTYDYDKAKEGKVGKHAILKSGLHSDGFFASKILLEPDNICRIMANQLVEIMRGHYITNRNFIQRVAGIPDGAKKLGEMVADILGVPHINMIKEDGKIKLVDEVPPDKNLLFVEDFCTRGTGFKEAAEVVYQSQPEALVIPYDPVLLSRGGLKGFPVNGKVVYVYVAPIVEHSVNDWPSGECPLCGMGSIPIKPKVTEESWIDITTSQQ